VKDDSFKTPQKLDFNVPVPPEARQPVSVPEESKEESMHRRQISKNSEYEDDFDQSGENHPEPAKTANLPTGESKHGHKQSASYYVSSYGESGVSPNPKSS
jgi:hypothetical protein